MNEYSIVGIRRKSHGKALPLRYYVEWFSLNENGVGHRRRRRIQLAHLVNKDHEKASEETQDQSGTESV